MLGFVLGGSAGAAGGATKRHARHTIDVKIPLPPPETAKLGVIIVKVTAPRGKNVGTLKVSTANDAQLGNSAVLYIIQAPRKKSGSETVKIYALIRRFSATAAGRSRTAPSAAATAGVAASRAHGAQDFGFADVRASYSAGNAGVVGVPNLDDKACSDLTLADGLFESGTTSEVNGSGVWTLISGRNGVVQPSPPEEVLDDLVAEKSKELSCSSKPEGFDPGGT